MSDADEIKDVFVWSKRFETGLHDIDQQHNRLIQMINAAAQMATAGATHASLSRLLDELDDYAGHHFKTEEELMGEFGLDDEFTAAHVRAHASLLEQIRIVRKLADDAENNAAAAVGRLLPFLTKWLIFHVLGTDMRMAHEIAALKQGESREKAQQQAVARQSESLIIVLDALNEITDNLTRRTTQLQESNQRLRVSEARYALAQRAAHIGSWDLELGSLAMSWSDELDPLFGFRLNDLSQPFEGLMACLHPEDRSQFTAAIDAVRAGNNLFAVQARIVWPDGSVHWLTANGECLRGRAGEADRIVGVMRDITEEKISRERLHETNQQLKLSLAAVERFAADLTRLNELNEGLQSCLTASEAFEVVERTLARLSFGSGGALAIQAIGETSLKTVARWGDGSAMSPLFEASACWGMRRNQRHAVQHPGDGPTCKHFDTSPGGAYLCHPLQVLGETLGLLTITAAPEASEREWGRIVHLAAMVAESLKLALANVRLRETLHEQAIRDPLTGLLNRRYLDETLPREIMRAQREHRPLSLVMLDLDHFKRVNDTWGHEAGDAVLAHLATTLRAHLRSSDLACRFGGEEFVVVMMGATLAEARERIEQIAGHVRAAPIQLPNVTLPAVTFSAGLVQAAVHGDSAEALLRAADHALYAAKEAGRDRVHEAT